MKTILKAEKISKQYRLGTVGMGTIGDDMKRWWCTFRGREDPFLRVGSINDPSTSANEDYIWALKNINFEVKEGEVLGIVGNNGAGKSTLLKLLSRVTSPTTGKISTKGRIASLLEIGTGFHGELTGRENIFMNGAVLGMKRNEIRTKLDEIIFFSGCEKYIDTPVKRYSSGMTVRLGFAVAAHLEPEILVVDEVLAVGDAEFQKRAIGKMQNLSSDQGRTVLFVSHNMASVRSLCNRAMVLENGINIFVGDTVKAINHYLSDQRSIVKDLELIEDRSGDGSVQFRKFYIVHSNGQIVDKILSGDSIEFCFEVEVTALDHNTTVDLGFSIHTPDDNLVTVLYSSYQNACFRLKKKGRQTIKCKINDWPMNEGEYVLKGRIEYGKQEADWPKRPLGKFQVIQGDFYETGKTGFSGKAQILLKGKWNLVE